MTVVKCALPNTRRHYEKKTTKKKIFDTYHNIYFLFLIQLYKSNILTTLSWIFMILQ